jgi:hypothetical protein
LVLERNQSFGGAATVYRHGELATEASLHEIDGLDAEDPKAPILGSLGLDRDIPFVDVGDLGLIASSGPRAGGGCLRSGGQATGHRAEHPAQGQPKMEELLLAGPLP